MLITPFDQICLLHYNALRQVYIYYYTWVAILSLTLKKKIIIPKLIYRFIHTLFYYWLHNNFFVTLWISLLNIISLVDACIM